MTTTRTDVEAPASDEAIGALARLLTVVGEGTRLRIVLLLGAGPRTVPMLAPHVAANEQRVHRVLLDLRSIGLVDSSRFGGEPLLHELTEAGTRLHAALRSLLTPVPLEGGDR